MSRTRRSSVAQDASRLPVPAELRPAADQMTDVVVVGSGPGALAAAVACRQAGWEVLVCEATGQLGGPEASEYGQLWLPGRPDLDDDYASARDYLDRVVGDPTPASSAPRRRAYLEGAAALGAWLADLGVGLHADLVGDHHPELPGGLDAGRVLVPQPVDAAVIGQLAEVVPPGRASRSVSLIDKLEDGARAVGEVARGRRTMVGGAALVTGLLAACQRLQVNIWWDAPVHSLVTTLTEVRPSRLVQGTRTSGTAEREATLRGSADGRAPQGSSAESRITGVVVQRGGRAVRVFAGRGVILAQGGFEGDAAARRAYLPTGTRPAWTLGSPRTDGVRQLEWAAELGLDLAGLGDAWWRPGLWNPSGIVWDAAATLAAPHGFVVDTSGRRFANEAGSGNDLCRALFARGGELGPEAAAWLIVDADHRRKYPLGPISPGRIPKQTSNNGVVLSARTLPELAWKIRVDAAGLQATADRFDEFAATGVDADFGRGSSAADQARGDASHRPNPCLGAVARGPFHAVRVVPADAGTKGGLLVDEHARVLRLDGAVQPGLWAIGSSAASVTASADPAPGAGLAEAMAAGRAAAADLSVQP